MDQLQKNILHRTEMVIGSQGIDALARAKIIIFGVGGVGSWCAEGLIRSGLMHLTIVDSDIVCATNINRQSQATSVNIGNVKVDEMRKKLLEINPFAEIIAFHKVYDHTTSADFNLQSYDYVIDAIDSLSSKIHLIEECFNKKIKIYSSMGAGAKIDPTKIKAGKLENTQNCPLARHVRRELRKRKIPLSLYCVYSDELPVDPQIQPMCGTRDCTCTADRAEYCEQTGTELVDWCARKKRINGSLVQITAVFGFMLSALVIQDILKQKDADSAV